MQETFQSDTSNETAAQHIGRRGLWIGFGLWIAMVIAIVVPLFLRVPPTGLAVTIVAVAIVIGALMFVFAQSRLDLEAEVERSNALSAEIEESSLEDSSKESVQ